jgi:hypothetical protein
MLGQTAGNEENGIDANVVALARVAGREPLRCDRHAPQSIPIERLRRAFLTAACLDLDEGKNSSPASDKVDFATRYAGALRENSPAVEAKPPGGQPFGPTATLLGNHSPVQRESSKARA